MKLGGLGPLQPYFSEFCRELNIISLDNMTHAGITSQFIVWIGFKWMEWRSGTGKHGELTDEDHLAFAAWLPGRVDEILAMPPWRPGFPGTTPDDCDGETERTESDIEATEDHDRRALDP